MEAPDLRRYKINQYLDQCKNCFFDIPDTEQCYCIFYDSQGTELLPGTPICTDAKECPELVARKLRVDYVVSVGFVKYVDMNDEDFCDDVGPNLGCYDVLALGRSAGNS